MKVPPPRFYDLQDLETDDIGFAWKCPSIERGGCLGYELRRQMGARVIADEYENHLEVPLVELRAGWFAVFEKPWSQLTCVQKEKWISLYNDQHLVPFGPHGKDPKPKWPGELYSVKIDWDLSDGEIRRRIDRALTKLRPRDPWRQRTETAEDQLKAIAAIRIIDCRGDTPTMKFVNEMTESLSRDDRLFEKETILMDAAKRFLRQESDLEVGLTRSGSLDIVLKAKEQGGMSK